MCVCREADGIRLPLHYNMENTIDADIPPRHNKNVEMNRILCGCVFYLILVYTCCFLYFAVLLF